MVYVIQHDKRSKSEMRHSREKETPTSTPGSVDNILIVEDFISKEKIEDWINLASTVSWTRGIFSYDADVNYDSEVRKRFTNLAKDQVKQAVNLASYTYGAELCVYSATPESVALGSFNRWDTGDSLKLHADSQNTSCTANLDNYIGHNLPPFLILYSALIYLNDNYEGGELHFPLHDIKIKPKPGTLVLFPGTCMYPHEVKEVLSGHRYTHNFFLSNLNLSKIYLDMFKMIESQGTKDSNEQTKATNYY
jgi:predicted 2-oxoglutarate/Fe(II)-dependent dioxygenase YbiX